MIRQLQITNYAIIEELSIQFSEGLTIVTGETGAGKSILLGALGLIMGERADTKALFRPDTKCVVEGRFAVGSYDLKSFFEVNDLDYEDELLIRREILPNGKTRAFVNDTPVNLKTLQDLSASLIDLHQQFDTLDIHNVNFQLRLLDALADNGQELAAYQRAYRQYVQDSRVLEQLRERAAAGVREQEFIAFQLDEFARASLVAGEQEPLEEELSRLSNAEEIKRSAAESFRFLCDSDMSLVGQLQEVGQALYHAGKVDKRLSGLYERFNSLVLEIQEVGDELEHIAESTEYDPARIMEIQQRLDLIYRLQKKHGLLTVEELLNLQATLASQRSSFERIDEDIASLAQDLAAQQQALLARAQLMSQRRQEVAPAFAARMREQLATLSMPSAQVEIDFRELAAPGPTGLDEVQFLFSANRGSRPLPIKDVASGGELSRLTLVAKSLVASAMALPTLIFDEIDAGVSGDVALKMGDILRKLSDHHQVVVITHSPQVAAKADVHYFIYKVDTADRTSTKVRLLDEEERTRAIATMLSMSPPTASALENARELIASARAR
jgi:DNA repair protein RecN (Recombination protein N)